MKNINSLHKEFSRLIVTQYVEYKRSLSLAAPKTQYVNLVSTTVFTGKHGNVRTFFGAPEWHIEFEVESYGMVWNFADIISVFPCVSEWIAKNKTKAQHDSNNFNRLECEIIFFYRLLVEMISTLNEFSWLSNTKPRYVVQSDDIIMPDEESVEKLKKQCEIETDEWHTKMEEERMNSKLEKAWLEKDYNTILVCAESLKRKNMLKSKIAKINYARKFIDKTQVRTQGQPPK